ncbi:hypothetical protein [Nonomuraea sp. LPB2021202275-12-8]|uniref:hypothetical protein n=1 Tax=Nonomuraea sp. LPB2021202275-12-8 TaxID=3120159 RepID=UPI00300C97DD
MSEQDAPLPLVPVIPEGHILAPSAVVWLEADAYLAGSGWHRRDWRRSHARVGEALALNTTAGMQTRPGMTWETLAADANVGRTALWKQLRWRREQGLLVTVTTGSTPRTRRGCRWGRDDDGLGNLAAEYALIIPEWVLETLYGPEWAEDLGVTSGAAYGFDEPASIGREIVAGPWDDVPWPCPTRLTRAAFPQVGPPVDEKRTPRFSDLDLSDETPTAHERERGPAREYTHPSYPLHAIPTTRRDRITAGERIRTEHMTLRGLSARDLARIGRPVFEAGGTLADLVHVLNVHPLLGQWTSTAAVLGERSRSMWELVRLRRLLEARVAAWLGQDGLLVAPLPSQVRSRAREALAEDGGWRERLAEVVAAPDPVRAEREHVPSAPPAEARAWLRERLAEARTRWAASEERGLPGALLLARRRAERERRD